MADILHVPVARVFVPLLQPARYKGAHGGRGSAKSHFFADQVVSRCVGRQLRVVCIREVQATIKESVKQLILDKIEARCVQDMFEPLSDEGEIRAPHGGLVIFRGMQSFNAENIKSLEGYDIAWVEEAQTLSERSLRMLRPTIRKEGSELWFSWNPRHDTDAVDKLLRGPHKPKEAIVVESNWNHNPWLPEVLRKEKDADYAADPEMAEHVWGGGYEIISEGAYYARALAQADKEGRIGHFPWDGRTRIRTAWDLGIDDYTAIWFIADDGFTATVLDYYEVSGDGYDEIISVCMPELFIPPPNEERFTGWSRENALKLLERDQPFKYAGHFLPHDVRVREQGSGGRHRYQIIQSLGVRGIHKGVATAPEERVAAVRKLLPIVRFNNTPRVARGLQRLRRYSRKMNDQLGTYTGELHDINSHGAHAFGEWAMNCGIEPPKALPAKKVPIDLTKISIGTGEQQVAEVVVEPVEDLTPQEKAKRFIEAVKRQRKKAG